jgi:hypothetical protein
MACGLDLWDVPRHVRAGNVVVCDRCVGVMSDALEAGPDSGRIEVAIPPQVSGPVPDADAVASVIQSFTRTFHGKVEEADRRAEVMEDADEVGPMLDYAARTFGANLDTRPLVDRVRFPDSNTAEVRFRILFRGSPEGMKFEGRAIRRRGRWLVTRETVVSVLPGGAAMGMGTTILGRSGTFRPGPILPAPPPNPPEDEGDEGSPSVG